MNSLFNIRRLIRHRALLLSCIGMLGLSASISLAAANTGNSLTASEASSAPRQKDSNNHTVVQRGVKNYLQNQLKDNQSVNQITIDVADIDQRIQIVNCPAGFNYHADENSFSQAYISVRVSCNNNEWYLFANARILRTQPVVVTASMISPGTVLDIDNLRVAQVETNRLRHTAYHTTDELIGARMKRRVRQGQPIQANMLCFICKGDRITISAQVGGMRVRTSGIAQQDGVLGENIKVINASSQKLVIAEVASTDEVVVRL